MKTIYHCGPIQRSEIALRLGLTLPTVTVNGMMARGIVRETGSDQPSSRLVGQSPGTLSASSFRASAARPACWTTGCALGAAAMAICKDLETYVDAGP